MAYGTQMSRGVLGDPSSQARGRRTPEMTKEQRERKEKKKEQKPPKDVPLRKWKSHRNALGDMKDGLKDLKKKIREEDDPTEKAKLQNQWEAGFDEYDTTKKQLQQVRNSYQASWEEQVGIMEEEDVDVQRTDKRRFLKRYTDGVDTYKDLRENSISLDSWEPGKGAPKFSWLEQQLNEGETATRADGSKVDQWTFDNPRLGEPMTLDKIPTVIDPSGFKFYEQSYTATDGDFGAEVGGMTEFNPKASPEPGANRSERNQEMIERLEGLQSEEEREGQYAFEQAQRALRGEITQEEAIKNANAGTSGAIERNRAKYLPGGKDGLSTAKRKKYDIDGNRIE